MSDFVKWDVEIPQAEIADHMAELSAIFASLGHRARCSNSLISQLAGIDRWRWVSRNDDKPHRCPICHAVADWDRTRVAPRTTLVCPAGCRVRWKYGVVTRRHRHLGPGKSSRRSAWHGWHNS